MRTLPLDLYLPEPRGPHASGVWVYYGNVGGAAQAVDNRWRIADLCGDPVPLCAAANDNAHLPPHGPRVA